VSPFSRSTSSERQQVVGRPANDCQAPATELAIAHPVHSTDRRTSQCFARSAFAQGSIRAKFRQKERYKSWATIYVAPSDHRMLIEHGRIRVWKGPKIHTSRQAIDRCTGPRGAHGHAGRRTAGLEAIKDCGGLAIVQDVDDAQGLSRP
jgi:hypothetical protein